MKKEEIMSILKLAVQKEINAHDFYTKAASKVKDKSVQQLFEELAQDELQHRQTLEKFIESEVTNLDFKPVLDYKVADTVEHPEPTLDMSFVEAVALSMKHEQDAMDMYTGLSVISIDEDVKNLFHSLANMEQVHKTKLEELYNNVAFAEQW